MKKTFLPFLLAGVSLTTTLGIASAFAQSADVVVPVVASPTTVVPQTENPVAISTNNLTTIKARGAALIKQRVSALTNLLSQLNGLKTLSADQKTGFSTSINAQVSALNTLGGTISSSTDASSTKSLVKSIYTDFRIFSVFIPQIKLERRIDDLQNHTTKLTAAFAKIQTNINAYAAKGHDVTAWQTNLTNAQNLVASDTQILSTLMTTVQGFKPADYPTQSKTEITSANASLKAIAKDFNSVVKSSRNPYPKKMKTASTTATSTSVTASTTVSH